MPQTASNVTFSVLDQFYDPATRSDHGNKLIEAAKYPQKLVNNATNSLEETFRSLKSNFYGNEEGKKK